MMTTATWAAQTRALAPNFRLLLHDFRGQLRSAKPPGPYSMPMHVGDFLALLDEQGIERAHLVGTSYGGEVALMFAAAYPERVRSLTVIACVSRVNDVLAEGVTRWARTAREEPERLWDVTAPYNYSPRFLEANPGFAEAARQRMSSLPADWYRALADLCEAFITLNVDLAAIRCPTLVIAAERDVLKPLHCSREIADGIAGARLEVIEGAGHAVVIEGADAVNARVLGFLRTLTGAAA
jgi:3-oxoadipate enol-lactonase